jgi:hypothetical protein
LRDWDAKAWVVDFRTGIPIASLHSYFFRATTDISKLPIVSTEVLAGSTEAEVTVSQLGKKAGKLYITVTSDPRLESLRVAKEYTAEPVTAAPLAADIEITNNYTGIDDTIQVSGLRSGDQVNVYTSSVSTTLIGTGWVDVDETSVTISVAQLGKLKGAIFVTVTSAPYPASVRVMKEFIAEPVTDAPLGTNVMFNNAVGTESDLVSVTNLQLGDIVKIYASATALTPFIKQEVMDSLSVVDLSTTQLRKAGGTIYITVTTSNKSESKKTAVKYEAEPMSTVLTAAQVMVKNNRIGTQDVITIQDLAPGDVVKVYTSLTAMYIKADGTKDESADPLEIAIPQLSSFASRIYITVTSADKNESSRTKIDYSAE